MSLFRKRSKVQLEIEQISAQAANDVQTVYGPPGDLVRAIVQAAQSVREEVGPVFGYGGGGVPSEREILSFFEFLYFYIHMTLLLCVANDYTDSQTATLQDFVIPLTAATAVDSFFFHWSADRKRGLRSEFFEKFNDAEQEYETCHAVIGEGGSVDPDSVFGRVASNACALWDRNGDANALMAVFSSTMRAYVAVNLEGQVAHVKTVIDRVDPMKLASFWAQDV